MTAITDYSCSPEKFLTVVYDDPRGAITVKFPIAKKDGKLAGIILLSAE